MGNDVTLAQNLKKKRGGNIANEKSKIILTEYGPRMTLNLIKVQEGVNDGEVIYHQFIQKTEEEVMQLQKTKNNRLELKKERRELQERNIEAKKEKKRLHKEK